MRRVGRHVLWLWILVFLARPASAATCFAVDLRFKGRTLPPGLLAEIQRELSAVWAPYGVRFVTFDDSEASAPDRIDGSFDVLIERSATRVTKSDGVVLGATHLQWQKIDHSPIHIDYDAIEQTIGEVEAPRRLALTGHSAVQSADVARAAGRVLAHEIGHVLLLAPSHEAQGLMRAAYHPEDLIAAYRDSFTLSRREIARLHSREEGLTTPVTR